MGVSFASLICVLFDCNRIRDNGEFYDAMLVRMKIMVQTAE
jgi:hypothetical protein